MKKDKPKAQEKISEIQVSELKLWHLEFTREEGVKVEIPSSTTLDFTLGIGRISLDTLVVDLSVTVKNITSVKAAATYRAHFKINVNSEDSSELEQSLKRVAAQTAPAILFPYLREAMSSVATKAGLNKLILPIVNFQNQFPIEDIELPKIEERKLNL